ncbi:ERAD-associated E3 ubiquitin-protein ligase component HRD3 [Rhynchospora pubera]|uniref:ERAD-associated E3 ubiquitin-protein ligase component HRD3 n=1 Tax=Rhynchospora pubera TaxID=906938 RepID=A0AAV8C5R1_9POAL|nr:ERAD-associated E3 ubiquitin-protein ligase component HRD3 [Rhynchospora pubera]
MPRRSTFPHLLPLLLLLLLSLLRFTVAVRPFVLVISNEDLIKDYSSDSLPSESEWDDFSPPSASFADPWLSVLDPSSSDLSTSDEFSSSLSDLIAAFSSGDPAAASAAAAQIAAEASDGAPAAQSVIGFLYGAGVLRTPDKARHFMYHSFAADGGDLHSKMALAYSYFRQEMYEKAVVLYAELAEAALTGFLMSKEPPMMEAVRLHSGTEENREALRKSRGEDDEDFQITEYQAQRGNAAAMYKLGLLYYYGLRGLRRDHAKARYWFFKAVEKGDTRAMELLGEIYARGAGVERNYTKAFEWLSLAAKQQYYSAYNGLGYLYVKGYGVEEKNLSKAKEYFQIAAEHKEPGGHYNLGVLYLKGLGVKRDVVTACNLFLVAANAGQPKALYQVAKLFQKGIGLKKNLQMATLLFKTVAERGPWSSLSRWALEAYLKGDTGKALFLYSRMAELGYEVAQSNAAWILDRYGEQSMCMGEAGGFCSDTERHLRAHSLWWQASEQGNEHAALLIGDAYYYGRGIERDYERAAEAYLHAQSQSNAQAMFNLGYMHEHGQGLPLDLHLAKRYYDQALDVDPAAKLPVALALFSLWVRKNYAESFLVSFIDALPDTYPRIQEWVEGILMDEGNATILTLLACLITVLYLRERQRRQAGAAANVQPPEVGLN